MGLDHMSPFRKWTSMMTGNFPRQRFVETVAGLQLCVRKQLSIKHEIYDALVKIKVPKGGFVAVQ